MTKLNCILSVNTLVEAIMIGIITFIIGKVFFRITSDKTELDNEYKNKPYGLNLTFFLIGFLLHYIIEIVGLNQWYCDKKCMDGILNLAKLN